ncbi:hypothetical protein [Sphingomonas jatrophae]|uniref:Uncharacterized protein n=1 Tax=Sphingomonas jatrophae TaxID=1166337 RepID=A0A1I6JNK1_9SPHN|nr:hypothetical protein [Sphingomonas jatrophae]SFR80527.1 hypothetical protein SAMN05192580_0587 [Sphingomonas jatrophae]
MSDRLMMLDAAVQELGDDFKQFELQMEQLLMAGNALGIKIAQKRIELGIAAPYTQDMVAGVQSAVATVAKARGEFVGGHLAALVMKKRLAKRVTSWGDCCEAPPLPSGRVVTLREVA